MERKIALCWWSASLSRLLERCNREEGIWRGKIGKGNQREQKSERERMATRGRCLGAGQEPKGKQLACCSCSLVSSLFTRLQSLTGPVACRLST